MHAAGAAFLLASESAGDRPLEMGDVLVYLAIITAATFFVVIAGLGYFGDGNGNGREPGGGTEG